VDPVAKAHPTFVPPASVKEPRVEAAETSGGLENFCGGNVGGVARVISLRRCEGERALGIELRFDLEALGIESVDRIDQEGFWTVEKGLEETLHFLRILRARNSRRVVGSGGIVLRRHGRSR